MFEIFLRSKSLRNCSNLTMKEHPTAADMQQQPESRLLDEGWSYANIYIYIYISM
uniref:Uncharacterized protein n=1 Tax=Physcomitrium patens TaxID=3218 RepID=A0A2K1KVC6_PHYPA|nr:hypothetical protein PHYPA_004690 [Physcomitrium patens]